MTTLSYDEERTARELAAELMLDGARDVEPLTIGERLDDEIPEARFDAIRDHVADLIAESSIEIRLPASPNPLVQAAEAASDQDDW